MKNFAIWLFVFLPCFGIAQMKKNVPVFSEVGLYTLNTPVKIAPLKKELKTLFPNYEIVDTPPKEIDKNMIFIDFIDNVPEKYPVADMEYLKYFAADLSLDQKKKLLASKYAVSCILFTFKKDSYKVHQKFYKWIYKKVKNTDYIVYDGETREFFIPRTWKLRRVDSWQNGIPNIPENITIHAYREGAYCRSITLGMQRFGLPDLVIKDSPCSNSEQGSYLLNAIGQLLAEEQTIQKEQITVDLNAIQNTDIKQHIKDIAYENASRKAVIKLKKATRQEGDPFNLLLQVDYNNPDYSNPQAYENEILKQLFGSVDDLTMVMHNDLILEASDRAQKKLPELKKLFNKGLGVNSSLLLKAPFKTDDEENEWMWIEVTKWKGNTIEGILQNEPVYVSNLKSGAKVKAKQKDIFDYILYKSDGTTEGNETGKLIMKYQKN